MYIRFLLKYRSLILSLITLITVLLTYVLSDLKINSSPYFMPQEHETRVHELSIKKHFLNSGEQILVIFKSIGDELFDIKNINEIVLLSEQFNKITLKDSIDTSIIETLRTAPYGADLLNDFEKIDSVEAYDAIIKLESLLKENEVTDKQLFKNIKIIKYLIKPIERVRSLSTLENMTSENDEIDLHYLIDKNTYSDSDFVSLRNEVVENPLFEGLLVSEDYKASSIQIELTVPKDDNPNIIKIYQEVKKIVDQSNYAENIYMAGGPVIDAEMALSMERDNQLFFPFVLLIISLILYLCFFSVSALLIPIILAAITCIWTMSIMVFLDIPQNIVTTILPVFLLTIAVADAIHFISFFKNGFIKNENNITKLTVTTKQLKKPLILTSVTTFLGFIALAWTDIIFIREFGIFMAIGVLIALLLTFTLVPILLSFRRDYSSPSMSVVSFYLEKKLHQFSEYLLKNGSKVLTLIVIIFISNLIALPFLEFDQENINNFSESTTIRKDYSEINQHYAGTIPLDIWIDTGKSNGIYDEKIIKDIKKIEDYLNARSDVGYVISPVGFLERMYNLLTDEGHKLPDDLSSQLIAQEILVYENERSQEIKNVIDDLHRHARIIVFGEQDSASYWSEIISDIKSLKPANVSLEINGYGKVVYSNLEEVIKTNITSTFIALIFITLIISVLFKSLIIGLIGVIPLILTVLTNYSLMALSNTPVDVGTTIIASIAFGIGIDYSIHLISKIKEQQKSNINYNAHISKSMAKVGVPILINSFTLAGGFLVLTASNFMVLKLLGLFIAITMVISAIYTLTIIPILLYFLQRYQ